MTAIPRKTGECLLAFQVWNGGGVAGYVEAKAPGTELARSRSRSSAGRYLRTSPTSPHQLPRGPPVPRRGDGGAGGDRAGEPARRCGVVLDRFSRWRRAGAGRRGVARGGAASRARVLADRVRELLAGRAGAREISRISGLLLAFRWPLARPARRSGVRRPLRADDRLRPARARLRDLGPFGRQAVTTTSGGERHPARRVRGDLARQAPRRPRLDRRGPGGPPRCGGRSARSSAAASCATARTPVSTSTRRSSSLRQGACAQRRSVYYTPRPVVSYMCARSTPAALALRLVRNGLADPRASLLDPAAGTLTFLVEGVRHGHGGLRRATAKAGSRRSSAITCCRTSTLSS